MSKLQIEYLNIDKLIPYINNPRENKNAVDKVAASIKEFGFKNPIIIDKENVIIAGHTRLLASRKLGIEEVPIIRAEDLTDKQIKAFRIADNKTSEFAEWDMELLEIELEGLDDIFTGFDEEEFDDIMGIEPEIIEDDFDIEPPVNPISKRWDIWLLGEHKVMCGDATNEDVLKLVGDNKVNLYLTDPPYNVAYVGKTEDALTIQNDKMEDLEFRSFLHKSFKAADSVMEEGASFYIFHADSEGYNFRGACFDNGWTIRQCLIWLKNSIVMGRQDYHWKHEPCLYGWKDGAAHTWSSDRKQTTVLEFDRPQRNAEHPTMKPIPLFSYLIGNNTKKKDIVLDNFGGSGTTLIASEQLNRICYMMELDEKYVDVIVNRYIAFKEDDSNVFLIRDGVKIPYSEVEKND